VYAVEDVWRQCGENHFPEKNPDTLISCDVSVVKLNFVGKNHYHSPTFLRRDQNFRMKKRQKMIIVFLDSKLLVACC